MRWTPGGTSDDIEDRRDQDDGGGGGGFGGGTPQGPLLEPGSFMVRLTVGGETRMSSVDLLDDIWMRPQ